VGRSRLRAIAIDRIGAAGVVGLLVAASASGCGGGGSAASAAKPTAPTGGYLAGPELQRQIGNAFRKGLYRLSVMTQRSEDAKDLGQPLPTGVVEAVRCAAASAQPTSGGVRAWSCRVAWRGVGGTRVTTTYDVSLRRGGCFSAGAAPRRPVRYDATIATYAEDPLNALVSVRRGC
jgi:hypothetical protein